MPELRNLAEHIAERCMQGQSVEVYIKAFVPGSDNCQLAGDLARKLLVQYSSGDSLPPLFGKILGVKDIFLTGSLPTRAGSWLPTHVFSGQAAIPVAQLINAGAVLLGKTACSEFNYLTKPPTLNPLFPERTPGGSSSGSAAAVAAGLCDLALGSQSRAGIIMPAAFCGVYGFKPSSGRISRQGLVSFSPTLEQPGLITRELSDLQTAARILLNKDQECVDQTSRPVLGIPSQQFLAQADSEILDHFEFLLGILNSAGFAIRQMDTFSDFQQLNRSHHNLFAAEFTQQHIPIYANYGHLYSLASRELYESGMKVSPERLYEARELQSKMRESVKDEMQAKEVQILVSPSTATLPPLLSGEAISTALCLPFSFCGLPAISIPVFNHPTGLPFGLQISGAWGWDEYLLEHAERIQDTLI
jgi:Asp-tRNA(Asn)/Glu-tRNA(Gln) amidotransferase A subunit family amidase